MLANLTLVLGLATAVTTSAVLEGRSCANNCARALKNTAKPGLAVASVDCSAFMYTTITPSAVTSTTTLTVLTSDTTVIPVTATETDYDTATELVSLTATVSTTLPLVVTRRAAAATGLPAYASACADAVAYSSACSCLGVLASTITLPVPTTVSTALATVVDTSTVTSTASTATVTVVDGTTTQSSVVATQTAAAESGFTLQVATGTAVGQYTYWNGNFFTFTADESLAQVFYINKDTGYLYNGASTYVGALQYSYQYLHFDALNPNYYNPLSCVVNTAMALSCTSSGGFNMFVDYFGNLAWASPSNNLAGGIAITFRAVPV